MNDSVKEILLQAYERIEREHGIKLDAAYFSRIGSKRGEELIDVEIRGEVL